MTPYALATGLTSFTFLLTGYYVYSRNRKLLLYQRCFIFSASVAVWAFGYFVTLLEFPNFNMNIWASRISHASGAFIPITYLHFVWAILNRRTRHRFFMLAYVVSALMCVMCLSPLVVKTLLPKMGLKFYPEWGILYPLYSALFVLFPGYAQFEMGCEILKTRGKERMRLICFFVALALAFLGGISLFLLIFNIQFAPFFSVLIILYPPMMAYTILVYNFLDIDVIIRKTLVFAGLSTFVFGVFTLTTFVTQELLSNYIVGSRTVPFMVSILIVVASYDALRKILINITDNFLFQKKFDYQKLLKDASTGISKIKSLNHLLDLVVHFVTMRVRVKNAAVIMFDAKSHTFNFSHPRGYPKTHRVHGGMLIDRYDPLIDYLACERTAIDIERIKKFIDFKQYGNAKNKNRTKKEYNFELIKMRMEELEASCCVPSFLGKELKNVLILGEKKSGDYYTEQDLNVLYTLAQESAIAIENARLYDEAIEKAKQLESINHDLSKAQNELVMALSETERYNVKLQEANRGLKDTQAQLMQLKQRALLSGMTSAVGHEIRNPLTPILMQVETIGLKAKKLKQLHDNILKGVSVEKNQKDYDKQQEEIVRRAGITYSFAQRIRKIVDSMLNWAKDDPDPDGVVNIRLAIDGGIQDVKWHTYWERLTEPAIDVDVERRIPHIKGNMTLFVSIFSNLMMNSLQAMKDQVEKKISIRVLAEPENPNNIMIVFKDNGPGMSEEIQRKVFDYGFTTKGKQGTGLGLHFCRSEIEKKYGGSIEVNSEPGTGATFTLRIPIEWSSDLKPKKAA